MIRTRKVTRKELNQPTMKVLPKCLVWSHKPAQQVPTPQQRTRPSPHPQQRESQSNGSTLIVLLFIGIVFRKIFVNEISNEMANENEFEFENVKCELELEKVNCHLDFYNCCPTPAPTIYFNGIDIGIFENNILECIFNVICNGNGFVCGKNIIVDDMNNENFYYNGYYEYYEYPTPTPAPTPGPTINFNGIHTGLRRNNILKGVYCVDKKYLTE